MPDLKDKYSDSELDRSHQAFEEMVNRPDMQAENDRGDAIARDLERHESKPDGDSGLKEKGGATDTRQAEEESGTDSSNGFYNQKPEKQSSKPRSGWSNRRKLIAAGAGGGGIAAIIASMMLLLPMKVPGLLALVTDKAGQRVEQITEKRAKLIVGRAILTKFGTHTGIVLTGDGAFKSLVASMRTSGFEKRLAAKGLTITATKDGVVLRQHGEIIGNGNLKNEKQIVAALEGNRVTNKVLKDIIKEDIPSWRWMKRAKFAKWLRIKYGISRYGLEKSNKDTEEERAKDYDQQRVKEANRRTLANFNGLVKCLMVGSCDQLKEKAETSEAYPGDSESRPPGDIKEAGDTRLAEVTSKGLAGLTEKFSATILKVFGSKAVPVVGWVDLVATIDHMLWKVGNEDFFGKLIAYYRGAAYAAVYADWAGYSSQQQLGDMDPNYVGHLAKELDGAERARSFQAIEGKSGGVPIEMLVGSDKPSEVSKAFKTYVDSVWGNGYKYIFHPVMNFYYETVGGGGLLGWIGEKLGDGFGKAIKPFLGLLGSLTPDFIKQVVEDTVKDLMPFLLQTFGLTLDSFEHGAKLFNNIMGGGVVSFNDYCHLVIGCRLLTAQQAVEQDRTIASEKATYSREQGLAYTLFSTDNTASLTSKLAMAAPTSPSSAIRSVGFMVGNIPNQIAAFISPFSHAEDYSNLYGVAMYGATQADLNRPLSAKFLNGDPCPETDGGDFNDCLADQITAEAMLCEFQPESEDCSDQDPASASSGALGDFNVASYNVLGASHSDGSGNRSDEAESGPRMELAIKTLAANDVSIVGLQEFENKQRDLFLQGAGDIYDIYPQTPSYGGDKPSANSIAWRKSEFSLVKGETRSILYFEGNKIEIPVVKLKHIASGKEFYVTNTHDPANTSEHPRQQQYRVEDARRHINFITNLYGSENIPILFTGDFNSSFDLRDPQDNGLSRSELTYCILTESGIVRNSYDVAKNRTGACPTRGVGYIDHVYVTKDVNVSSWKRIKNNTTDIASDHYPVVVTVDMGIGAGETSTQDGWAWPLGEKAWKEHRSSFLGSHYNGGGFVGSSGYSVDISWGESDTGSPIYSMLDGTVKVQPLGRSSYLSCSDTSVKNNGGMIIESNLGGHTIQIAYGHGSNPQYRVGETVKAGQQILKLGNVGNSCGSHLHMDMTYDGKNVCPQDVFLALDKGGSIDMGSLVQKASIECKGRG
jgi:murein DD-endopeptidase MepM/ murein hydrolase activator NlpD